MKTAQEKYENDPDYHMLVETLYAWIVKHRYTPSELREAAMFASIMYEQNNVRPIRIGPVAENES